MQYPSIEIYVIDPKTFIGHMTRVLQFNSILIVMSNTPRIFEVENELAHGVL
jgi:hypothetical protein